MRNIKMDSPKLKSVLESLLFAAGEPIQLSRLAKMCSVPKNEAEEALAELSNEYIAEKGLRIINQGDSYQFVTSPENHEFVSQLVNAEINSALSRSAGETLSIIAYRGPITRTQIDAIRGVNSTYSIRSLLLRGLVDRKESTGIRGFLYEISFEFLKALGLESAKKLPGWEELSKNEKVTELLVNSENENEEKTI